MLKIHRQYLREACPACSIQSVGCVIRCSPGVGDGVTSCCKFIKHSPVLVVFGSHENEMFQRVWSSGVIVDLCGKCKIAMNLWTLPVAYRDSHPSPLRFILSNFSDSIVRLEVL